MNLKRIISTFLFFFKRKRIVAFYKCFNLDEWLPVSITSIIDHVDQVLIVESDKSWSEKDISKTDDGCSELEELLTRYKHKILIVRGEWGNQFEQVNFGLNFMKNKLNSFSHCLYIDSDEIYEEKEIKKLVRLSRKFKSFNREVRANMFTYFKSPFFQVDPIENFKPMVMFPLRDFVELSTFRNVNLGFVESDVFFHHLSYVRRNDQDIKNKMLTHKNDEGTDVNWFTDVYLKWTPEAKNFHPKEPAIFKGVKVLKNDEVPSLIKNTYDSWNK